MGVNAIARRLSLGPSSCFNILKTLCAEDAIEFDERAKTYFLAGGMIGIARRALDPDGTYEQLRLQIEMLAENWSLTAGLWRNSGRGRITLVGYAVGAVTMRIHMTVGQRLPLLIGATGRSIAAFENWSRDAIEEAYAQLHWQRPLAIDQYLDEVDKARQVGWAADEGWFIRGATTLAAPVSRSPGRVDYCVTATMFNAQHSPEACAAIGNALIAIAGTVGDIRPLPERVTG